MARTTPVPWRELDRVRARLGVWPGGRQSWSSGGPRRTRRRRRRRSASATGTRSKGVPHETRQPSPDGTTDFERILPGPDRMYPDTDSPPTRVTRERVARLGAGLAERPWDREARYAARECLRHGSFPDPTRRRIAGRPRGARTAAPICGTPVFDRRAAGGLAAQGRACRPDRRGALVRALPSPDPDATAARGVGADRAAAWRTRPKRAWLRSSRQRRLGREPAVGGSRCTTSSPRRPRRRTTRTPGRLGRLAHGAGRWKVLRGRCPRPQVARAILALVEASGMNGPEGRAKGYKGRARARLIELGGAVWSDVVAETTPAATSRA